MASCLDRSLWVENMTEQSQITADRNTHKQKGFLSHLNKTALKKSLFSAEEVNHNGLKNTCPF